MVDSGASQAASLSFSWLTDNYNSLQAQTISSRLASEVTRASSIRASLLSSRSISTFITLLSPCSHFLCLCVLGEYSMSQMSASQYGGYPQEGDGVYPTDSSDIPVPTATAVDSAGPPAAEDSGPGATQGHNPNVPKGALSKRDDRGTFIPTGIY
jgi:hypothetical protein